MAHLDAVLHRLYRTGLTLNLKICHLFKDTVDNSTRATIRSGEKHSGAERYDAPDYSD
jgi:hypothetical protein